MRAILKGKWTEKEIIKVVNTLKDYIMDNVNHLKLIPAIVFINTQYCRFNSVSGYSLMTTITENIVYNIYEESATVYVNPNVYMYGTNKKVSDLAGLINYGNLSIHPYPIFTEGFNYIQSRFNKGG